MSAALAPCPWPIADLLPHAPPMILLDQVLGVDAQAVAAVVTIRSDHPFIAAEGVPVQVGIELMAQVCGAYAGANALAAGDPVKLGFLLGTRRYQAYDDWLRLGDRLEVRASLTFRDEEMGVFDCRIERRGELVAEAQLSVFQPKDPDAIVAKLRGADV